MALSTRKRPTVQLTSLLDLLFVMIFISLLQDKAPPVPTPVPVETVVTETPKEAVAPTQFSLTAVFHFFPVQANLDAQTGTFAMAGKYDQTTGELMLGGVSWIQRPEGYDMVPLSGRVMANENDFTGRVDFPGCQVFSLRRTSQSGSTPISGTWEGTYTCSQGQTGLLLTVQ
jgi:hypothetical protein